MSLHQTFNQLIRLHRRAEHHANEYKRLTMVEGAKGQAQRHRRKAVQLHSQISDLIRDCVWFGNEWSEQPLDLGSLARQASVASLKL
jgi:hypothetical protein